jgi:hypothetical protein
MGKAFENLGGLPAAVSVKSYKKSKSSGKLSSVPAANKLYKKNRENIEQKNTYISHQQILPQGYGKSPLRSARGPRKPTELAAYSAERPASKSRSRSRSSYKKEGAPIVINRED